MEKKEFISYYNKKSKKIEAFSKSFSIKKILLEK